MSLSRSLYWFAALTATLILFAILQPAFAADGEIPFSLILDPLKPYLVEIAAVLIAALVGWLVRRIHAWAGIEIEARHREALQSALTNAARLAAGRAEGVIGGKAIPIGNAVLEDGVEYVLKSVPDAVRHFGLTPDRLAELIRPKIGR